MKDLKFGKEIFVAEFEGSIRKNYEAIQLLGEGQYGRVFAAKNK